MPRRDDGLFMGAGGGTPPLSPLLLPPMPREPPRPLPDNSTPSPPYATTRFSAPQRKNSHPAQARHCRRSAVQKAKDNQVARNSARLMMPFIWKKETWMRDRSLGLTTRC